MPRLAQNLLLLLAFWAIGGAQVYGLGQAFVCDHHAEPVKTEAEHCHRSTAASDSFTPCAGDHEDESLPPQGAPDHHNPDSLELTAAAPALAVVHPPAFIAVLVFDLPAFDWSIIQSLPQLQKLKTPLDTGGCSPPGLPAVAHAIVMLV
jgi:hypothetical protein